MFIMDWIEFKDRFSRFGWFTKKEVVSLFLLVLCFAFILSFDQWGTDVFDASAGFANLVTAFFLVAVVVLIHHFVQRFVCVLFGFRPLHRVWWPGLVFSLFLVIVSNGSLIVFLGSVFNIQMREIQRLGWWRYGLNVKQQGLIAISGNIALIFLIGFLKLFDIISGSFAEKMIYFSILFVFFNMIPWPHSNGCLMMLGSRLYFVFLFAALIGFLVFFSSGFLTAAFLGLIIGMIAWFVFYWFYEKQWA